MKCISVNIIILSIFFFMQSCIKEDISNCNESMLQLRFRYTLNSKYLDLFGSEVRRVTAYIFDADGRYVGSYSEAGDKLANNYIMSIPLPEGRYQVIAFCDNFNTFSAGRMDNRTNSFNEELQSGMTSIADFRIMLNSVEGTDGYLEPKSIPGDLYVGYVANSLSTYDASYITNFDLMKDTKNITVKFSGLDLLMHSGTIPDIYITAINGRYNNDNSLDTTFRALKYKPYNTSVVGNTVSCDLKTMRLVIGSAPMLVIKHPSVSGYVFNRDITELILSNPKYVSQEDIDREDTFVFEVNFSQTGNNIVISVLINGWEINTVVPVND